MKIIDIRRFKSICAPKFNNFEFLINIKNVNVKQSRVSKTESGEFKTENGYRGKKKTNYDFS